MTAATVPIAWDRPIHAAGMGSRIYRIGFADTIIAMEDQGVRRHFPNFRRLPSLHGCGVWSGQLRPIAQSYDVRVEMAVGCADAGLLYPRRPDAVTVLGGAVRPRPDGTPVPHLYGPYDDPRGARLCLYYPPDEVMVLGEDVAKKLLPWAYEWLHYYEIWSVTGVWSGPEAPHVMDQPVAAVRVPSEGFKPHRDAIDGSVMRSMAYVVGRTSPARKEVLAAAA